MKMLLLAAVLLVAAIVPAMAHEERPAHYHAGSAQIAVGLVCDTYGQALDILRTWNESGFDAARAVFQSYLNDRSVSPEGACIFMNPTMVFIAEIQTRLPVATRGGIEHSGMVVKTTWPNGKTFYAVMWELVPGSPA